MEGEEMVKGHAYKGWKTPVKTLDDRIGNLEALVAKFLEVHNAESCEPRGEDKVHSENSKKRTLKTPSQVEALENLYNEHKYPSESLKSALADEIGLSEKQVSGWFCHRRLKDKNMLKDEALVIGRQDLSSGIVQDRGSALKQDSCSSTKPVEYKRFDPREVESRRFCGRDSPTEDLAYRNKGLYMHDRNNSILDNASSGSTSASQERVSPQSKNPYVMEPLRYSSRSDNFTLMTTKNLSPSMRGSELFNSQDEIVTAAILAVKRQLGRHYQEDGPPLGVKFDSIPPNAFDAPVEDTNNGPVYVGDSIGPKSVGVLKVHKEAVLDTGKRGMRPHSSDPEGDHIQIRMESDNQNGCSSYQSLGKSLTDRRGYGPDQFSSLKRNDFNSTGATGTLKKSKKQKIRPMQGAEEMKLKCSKKHFLHPCEEKVFPSGSSSYSKLPNHGVSRSHMLQNKECLKTRPPMIRQYDEHIAKEQREHARTVKEEDLFRDRRMTEENASSGIMKMQPDIEVKRRKTNRSDKYLPVEYASKTPSPHALYQMKEYAGEIPTSFSDDETAATSSSMD